MDFWYCGSFEWRMHFWSDQKIICPSSN